MQKFSSSISMTKTHMTKNFHKYICMFSQPMPHHHKKINAPPKFHHNQNFPRIHTQVPNFFYSDAKKFLHVQDKKLPTSSCPSTNKFSHSQNHNHKFSMKQHHTPNKIFDSRNFTIIKILHTHKFTHKILPCP